MNTLAIATHLNVLESAIVKIEEWASVLFVVAKGVGARFVSKKINGEKKMKTVISEIEKKSINLVTKALIDPTSAKFTRDSCGSTAIEIDTSGKSSVLHQSIESLIAARAEWGGAVFVSFDRDISEIVPLDDPEFDVWAQPVVYSETNHSHSRTPIGVLIYWEEADYHRKETDRRLVASNKRQQIEGADSWFEGWSI